MRKTYEEIETVNEVEEVVSGQIAEEVETVEPEIEPISHVGIVSGCKKLNVRSAASLASKAVCVINENDVVVIDMKESVDGWYKVCTEAGVEGFCMVQYITVKA